MPRHSTQQFAGKLLGLLVVVGLVASGLWYVVTRADEPAASADVASPPGEAARPLKLWVDPPARARDAGEDPPAVADDFDAPTPSTSSYDEAVDAFTQEARSAVAEIEAESFGQTLSMMADWESNYFKLVLQDATSSAAIPASLKLILFSRRYVKLLEETADGLSDAQRDVLRESIERDLNKLGGMLDAGQRFYGGQTLSRPGTPAEDLLIPLSLRLHAALLLAGHRDAGELLPLVVRYAEVMGEHVNTSLALFVCDRLLLAQIERRGLHPLGRAVLDDYKAWRTTVSQETGVFEYEVLELPGYRSAARPGDRAVAIGSAVDGSAGTVRFACPPMYRVYMRAGGGYLCTGGEDKTAREVIGYARRFVDAPLGIE